MRFTSHLLLFLALSVMTTSLDAINLKCSLSKLKSTLQISWWKLKRDLKTKHSETHDSIATKIKSELLKIAFEPSNPEITDPMYTENIYRYMQFAMMMFCDKEPALGMSNVTDTPGVLTDTFTPVYYLERHHSRYMIVALPVQKTLVFAVSGTYNIFNWARNADARR